MDNTCTLSCKSAELGREQKDHSVICAIMEVSVQYYQYSDVETNRCTRCYKVGWGEENGTDKTRFCVAH